MRHLGREGLPHLVSPLAPLPLLIRRRYIPLECDIAQQYCQSQFDIPFITANINPYNINETCTTLAEDLCYPRSTLIKNYLDRPEVRQDYGADASLGEFEICANKVRRARRLTALMGDFNRWESHSPRVEMIKRRPSSI